MSAKSNRAAALEWTPVYIAHGNCLFQYMLIHHTYACLFLLQSLNLKLLFLNFIHLSENRNIHLQDIFDGQLPGKGRPLTPIFVTKSAK